MKGWVYHPGHRAFVQTPIQKNIQSRGGRGGRGEQIRMMHHQVGHSRVSRQQTQDRRRLLPVGAAQCGFATRRPALRLEHGRL